MSSNKQPHETHDTIDEILENCIVDDYTMSGDDEIHITYVNKKELKAKIEKIVTSIIGEKVQNIASEYMQTEYMGLPLQGIQFQNQLKDQQYDRAKSYGLTIEREKE